MASACEIGIYGLGSIGQNLALNFAGQGYAVAAYDADPSRLKMLQQESEGLEIFSAGSLDAFIAYLSKPRVVMILTTAGPSVDDAINLLLPHLQQGDILIDGCDSHSKDTDRRAAHVTEAGIRFLGIGISGGKQGARNGPSLMTGGDLTAYERISPLFEAAAARVDGEPCLTYLGPGSAGHYVKMLHDGIEFGIMELIAETYGVLKQGLGLSSDKLCTIYDHWNREELSSYLLEMTARLFRQTEEGTGKALIDSILDQVSRNGSYRWIAQDSMDLAVPLPTIDMAIAMRSISVARQEREWASSILAGPKHLFQGDRKAFIEQLRNALHAAIIIIFAQGMAQLRKASHVYGYELNLAEVARIWRGGCNIRSALLKEISISFQERPDLANLLLDPYLGQEVMARQADLRHTIMTTVELGIPTPAMMSALSYYDSYRSERLSVNLIQAQRIYLGCDPDSD